MDTTMVKIIDLHNHTLPGVDDGAKTIEEAVKNIEYLSKRGVEKIVLTSHYIVNSKYDSNVEKRSEILETLKAETSDLNVEIYLGNEVFVTDAETLLDLIKRGEITTLNKSKYLLIELPLNQRMHNIENIICELNDHGYVPIIAHPERYIYIQKDYRRIRRLLEYDCLLQSNLYSITGYYGSSAKRTIKKLLKENYVSFIALDFHHTPSDDRIEKALKKLKKIKSERELKKLLYDNPLRVLENKEVERALV